MLVLPNLNFHNITVVNMEEIIEKCKTKYSDFVKISIYEDLTVGIFLANHGNIPIKTLSSLEELRTHLNE